jgi:ribosome-binding factor A
MSPRKPSRKEIESSCAEPGPDDGLDPRFDFRVEPRPSVNRKALQLCREVERTLNAVLAGECDDDVLRELVVQSVVPAPSTARLLVTVAQTSSAPRVGTDEVLARLQRAAGLLRGEVAAAVRRRKAPELAFRVGKPGTLP